MNTFCLPETGVLLCRLAQAIEEGERSGKNDALRGHLAYGHGRRSRPCPAPSNINMNAQPGRSLDDRIYISVLFCFRCLVLYHVLFAPSFTSCSVFSPFSLSHHLIETAGTFQARDNLTQFVLWCKGKGVDDSVMFEPEDLISVSVLH
jgi:hypothetical protein